MPMSDQEKLEAILALCRKYSHPGVNLGAHSLACKVIKIVNDD